MTIPLRLGFFEVDPVLAVAMHRGLFREEGVDLTVTQVTSSDAQFTDLAAGRYDLTQTAFDNVANYALNSGTAVGRRLDVAAVIPVDHGMGLGLVGRPGVTATEQLRGGTVSVDSPSSGYAYVVYALLQRSGLDQDSDCQVVSHGGAAQRLEKLLAGEADATLLTQELTDRATVQGCTVLGTVAAVCDPYLSSVLATRSGTDPGALSAVAAAYERARAFTLDADNQTAVIEAMTAVKRIGEDAAQRILAGARSAQGLVANGHFDPGAVRNTLLLRQRFHGFEAEIDLTGLAGPDSPLLRRP